MENNELIAAFMGVEPYNDAKYGIMWPDPTNGNKVGFGLKYHTSWDWLQPVFVKIMQTRHEGLRHADHLILHHATQRHSLSVNYLLDINLMYRACIEFIAYYNSLP